MIRFLMAIAVFTSLSFGSSHLKFEDKELEAATNFVGKMVKTKGGGVLIDRTWGLGAHKGGRNKSLFDLDTVKTDRTSKAYLKLTDGSKIIVAKGSKMKIVNVSLFEQDGGENTYDIKKRGRTKLKIITDFAKINIKGTLFKVFDTDKKRKVVLHKGVLGMDFTPHRYTLYSLDPKCGKPFILNKPESFDMRAGEALTFMDDKVYRNCFKPLKPEKDTITIVYEEQGDAKVCYTQSAKFNGQDTEPSIKAFDKGCYLKVPTKYRSCKKEYSFNANETKYFIENSELELVLMPKELDKVGFIQYRCFR